jgi:DNA (cytosine-5)-methyltransferase 1
MKVLDLFCGAGGAAMGLHRAWPEAEILGVDIVPQPRYPFAFVQADAMTFPLEGYDFIWASPPCQGYSRTRHLPWLKGKVHPLLIDPIRERLKSSGAPYCIENVGDSPLVGPTLCGVMFGLPVWRHRKFETSFFLMVPAHPPHPSVTPGRMFGDRLRAQAKHLGIDWMSTKEKSQAIPPVFAEYIARQAFA